MQIARTEAEIRTPIKDWRRQGETIAFVPTMGNLHAGHISLVDQAKARADRVVVSIFVNPLQFNDPKDLERYPRTFEADKAKLEAAGVDLLFFPEVETVYPGGMASATKVSVPGLSEILEGEHRPGHFTGVTTIVCKLFNLVQPDMAVFGKKDYQQLLLIKNMVADLNMPIDIIAADTVRETSGLAMSSRNGLLDGETHKHAAKIAEILEYCRQSAMSGGEFKAVEESGMMALEKAGFEPEYLSIREQGRLQVPDSGDKNLVILTAAKIGGVRLIDNVELERS